MASAMPYVHVAEIAAYIEEHQGRRSHEAAREAALKCIHDLLTATAVGIGDLGPVAIRQVAATLFPAGNSPIWFTGQTSSPIGAAWCNSSAAAALDLDDGNRFARGHPGAAIIPAVFAVARELGSSFEDILTAIVIGYEVGVSVGAARTTYGNSGTWTPYGVVAAAAALRRTPRAIVEHALAIAGESAPNQLFASAPSPRIPAPEGAAVKEGIPWSVVTGLTALHLAEAGHTGPRNILDSKRHYVFPDGHVFGSNGHICKTYLKPYACCRHIHAPLAALLDLMGQHDIDGRSIDRMEVGIHAAGLRISNRPDPKNLTDVQYSIPYCLALTALHGAGRLVPVTLESLSLDGVAALAAKVDLTLDPNFEAIYPEEIVARVTLTCGEQRFVSDPTPPKGEPLMPWEEIEAKFLVATRMVASIAQQKQILGAMVDAKVGDATALLSCLSEIALSIK